MTDRGRSTSVVVTNGRKKHYRWSGEASGGNKIANLINLPTSIVGSMTPEQLEAYALNYRIDELTSKLKLGDVVPPREERSPSPPPQYDSNGKRTNTTDVRYRAKLEQERHTLVEKALRTIPNYKPPADYRRPHVTQEKIYIPVNDYPEINFIGLLIGPRGKTLKDMEQRSGAKIAIRGKGSVKEGKGRFDNPHQQSTMDEDLHCLIISDSEEKIQKAIELVNEVIETAASIPEGQNELKRGQLRELAALNGTLRDDENQACQNCGEIGHRRYDCPQRRNAMSNITCRVCGGQGHIARDCKERRGRPMSNNNNNTNHMSTNPSSTNTNYRQHGHHQSPAQSQSQGQQPQQSVADREYEQLMAELDGRGGGSMHLGGSAILPPSAPWQQQQQQQPQHHHGMNPNNNPPPHAPRGPGGGTGGSIWQQRQNEGPWKSRTPPTGPRSFTSQSYHQPHPMMPQQQQLPPPPPPPQQPAFNPAPGGGRPPPPPPSAAPSMASQGLPPGLKAPGLVPPPGLPTGVPPPPPPPPGLNRAPQQPPPPPPPPSS
ncbi:branchpoint-bridging protein [Trichomonascus vanleenenianus]|uniref:mRNA splicing protein MSL5 n=1 Tax=Trichomonascus vanleenenianus TaxID=2268995 RepID=UPI003ECB88D6